jgi:DNA-binding CsgD family transcriptional regulator
MGLLMFPGKRRNDSKGAAPDSGRPDKEIVQDREEVPARSGRGMQLATRYRQVLVMLADGCEYKEIARLYGIKPATAWGYMEDIFLKNAEMREALAAHALTLLEKRQRNG